MLLLSFGLMFCCLIFQYVNVALFMSIKLFTVSGFFQGEGGVLICLLGEKTCQDLGLDMHKHHNLRTQFF